MGQGNVKLPMKLVSLQDRFPDSKEPLIDVD